MRNRSELRQPKKQFRSRTGTGATVLDGLDMRTGGGRRYKEVFVDLSLHLGGRPNAAEEVIIRRAAALCVWCERQEVDLAQGADFDVSSFTTAANTLRRLLSDIGLDGRAKDITPSLAEYMSTK
jgi:hypothetical protein